MLLIDLDPLIYACGFAAQKSHHRMVVEDAEGWISEAETSELSKWKKDHPGWAINYKETTVEAEPESVARMIFRNALRDLIASRPYRAFLSGTGNFRDELATIRPYKGNRDKTTRPVHYDLMRQLALGLPGVEYTVGIEADDAISINAHSGAWKDYVVVSVDKDLDQIVGTHWNYSKGADLGTGGLWYQVAPEEAQDCFVRQWIMGDPTDNIEGVPGIGPRKAAEIIKGLPGHDQRAAIFDEMVELYDGDEEACIETARLVYLLRKPTEIWEPSKWIAGKQ